MTLEPARPRRLVLVRHGETVGQSSIRYYGATDVGLSDSGRRQMERVRAALTGEAFDAVYTSGLQRTIAAAHIIAPHVPAQPVAGFNEINFGRWEGLTLEEIAARDPQLFERWRTALHQFTYPGGDAVPAFRARVAATLHAWLPAAPERTLLIVHKGIIATIIAELLCLAPDERARWPIDLASIHVLVATAGAWHAERVNQTDHLDGLE
jgi:broad specificity phosphatase PhoE